MKPEHQAAHDYILQLEEKNAELIELIDIAREELADLRSALRESQKQTMSFLNKERAKRLTYPDTLSGL
jgi:hypothetical protein